MWKLLLALCSVSSAAQIHQQWNGLIFGALPGIAGQAQPIAAKMSQIQDLDSPYALKVLSPLARRLEAASLTPAVFESLDAAGRAQALANVMLEEKELAHAKAEQIHARVRAETEDLEQIKVDARDSGDLFFYGSYYFEKSEVERLQAVHSLLKRQALSKPVSEKLSAARIAARKWLSQDPEIPGDPGELDAQERANLVRVDDPYPSPDQLDTVRELIEPVRAFAAAHGGQVFEDFKGMNPDHWTAALNMLGEAIKDPAGTGGRKIDAAFGFIEDLVTSQAAAAHRFEYADVRAHVRAMTELATTTARLRSRLNNASWGKPDQQRLAWHMRSWILEFVDDALGARDPRFKAYESPRGKGSAQYYNDWQRALSSIDEMLYEGQSLEKWRALHRLVREAFAGYEAGTEPQAQRLKRTGQKLRVALYRFAPLSQR